MTRKQKRLAIIGGLGSVLLAAALLIAWGFQSTFAFFVTPSELTAEMAASGRALRLGGLVEQGSCKKSGATLTFAITDGAATIDTSYLGIVPDLFREGQGVVVEGSVGVDGVFKATTVMAKHDENYIPKEIADELRERGEWYEGQQELADTGEDNPCR